MKFFHIFSKCEIFEIKILNFRFKIANHIRQSGNLFSASSKLFVISNELIFQKHKPLFNNQSRAIFINKFFYIFDEHDRARGRKFDCVIHLIDATKEVAQLEQPSFDRSVTIKIAIFTSNETRELFIADRQNQFTGLFVTF